MTARIKGERGFALPTVLLALVASFGIGVALVSTSIRASTGADRDSSTKSAFGVAEAGVSQALLRYNRFTTTTATPCVVEAASDQAYLAAAQANGWCAPVTATTSGGSYSYSVKPSATGIQVVSTGFFSGERRRIKIDAPYETSTSGGVKPFGSAQVIGREFIQENSGGRITADVATQGRIGLESGSKLTCTLAITTGFNPDRGQRTCNPITGWQDLTPVDSTAAKNSNSNNLITTRATGGRIENDHCWNYNGPWDAVNKRLKIESGCSITMGIAGQTHNFYLCKMTVGGGGRVHVPAGATVNVWFAPPNECGGDTRPFVMNSGADILPTASSPLTTFAVLVTSSATRTYMTLDSGGHWFGNGQNDYCSNRFIVYAPTSDITLNTGPHICGGIAGNSLTINSGSSLTKSSVTGGWEIPGSTGAGLPHYVADTFVECTPQNTTTTPDSGC